MEGITSAIITGPAEKMLSKLQSGLVDLTVTSPPYDNMREYNGHTFNFFTFRKVARELFRVTKKGGTVVWIVGDQTKNGSETLTSFRQALYFQEIGFRMHDTMIYDRHGPPLTHKRYEQAFEYMFVLTKGPIKTFNGIRVEKEYPEKRPRQKAWSRYADNTQDKKGRIKIDDSTRLDYNVWRIPMGHVAAEKYAHEHPAIFPELLAARHIKSWSNPGDIVLDPFCGCGTTAKMALQMGRKFIGIEINTEYVQLIKRRIADNRDERPI